MTWVKNKEHLGVPRGSTICIRDMPVGDEFHVPAKAGDPCRGSGSLLM